MITLFIDLIGIDVTTGVYSNNVTIFIKDLEGDWTMILTCNEYN